jgi:DNA-directed RNA polymerase subunit alpha
LSAPIEDLELSVRTFNCLKRGGVRQIKELIGVKMSDLQKLRHFSKKCADELNHVLKEKTGYEIEGEWVDDPDDYEA